MAPPSPPSSSSLCEDDNGPSWTLLTRSFNLPQSFAEYEDHSQREAESANKPANDLTQKPPATTPFRTRQTTLPWYSNRRPALKQPTKQQADDSLVSLTQEQQHVIDLINAKKNVFFTGPAGTGKSVLMRAIISVLRKAWAHDPGCLSVTASTGLAACSIGGQTLHSFAGVGLGDKEVPTLVASIGRNARTLKRWMTTKVLVIDEISMVNGDFFSKLEEIACITRKNNRPFGGLQLIVTGDFFQLPPVPDNRDTRVQFAFETTAWSRAIDYSIILKQVFRQKDPVFAGMLNEIRVGNLSIQTVEVLKRLERPLDIDDGIDVTELFPTRREVEQANKQRLEMLPGELHHFEAFEMGNPKLRCYLLANLMAPKAIDLKMGALVMLIRKIDDSLVNGSTGKVIDFMSKPAYKARRAACESNDPADQAEGPREAFREPSVDGQSSKNLIQYPVVRFRLPNGDSRTVHCLPELWTVRSPDKDLQVSRKQLPLVLAWALSIHKAQGQELYRVRVDLGKAFEKGQAYVALSRAVSQDGLQVLGFDPSKVIAHSQVVQFYSMLSNQSQSSTAVSSCTVPHYNTTNKGPTDIEKDIHAFPQSIDLRPPETQHVTTRAADNQEEPPNKKRRGC